MPKAFPDFVQAAYRLLDGEMSPAEEREFKSMLKAEPKLKQVFAEIRQARQAMQIYRQILPPASEFNRIRRELIQQLFA
ncbi:MAG: hypothetical protein GF404_12100 [candidate division Zixibacteria bacterium]|nr:hypothetical protein [candidate division Zixibacteria bacterium]